MWQGTRYAQPTRGASLDTLGEGVHDQTLCPSAVISLVQGRRLDGANLTSEV